jgi:HlyD family secretion protein
MSDEKRRNPLKILIPLLVIAAIGYGVWRMAFQKQGPPPGVVQLAGRIEGDDSAIAPKVAGRIVEIRFREGEAVNAGDVIATLDDAQLRARLEQAQAAVAEADARQRAASDQIAVLEEQIRQTELEAGQATQDADNRVKQAEAELAAAQSALAQQEASLKMAVYDRDAYTKLARDGAVSERQGVQAQSAAESQEAVVVASRRRVESARASLGMAQAALTNPRIRTSQQAAIQRQIVLQRSQVASAAADAVRARAQVQEAEANMKDLTVVAPFSGTVVTRAAEPGEVVTAGTAIVTLLDMSKVYLRGFVPEGDIGRVKLGQAARVYLDSAPDKPLDATVLRIDPQATFTPENTYFRDDRVKQVVGVKLQLKAGIGFAKPGMPADGEILVEGSTWPADTNRK